jgi:competence protein CoiA
MIFANDIFGIKIQAAPGVEGWCPACQEKMIAKCGEIKIWHWSHIGGTDCDDWHEPMTQWHIDWQSNFTFDLQEVVMSKGDQVHRADVRLLPSKIVVEFQHSPISTDDIKARELFYQKMIWVFDASEAYASGRFRVNREKDFDTFTWKQSKKSISVCTRNVVFDIGNDEVFTVSKLYPATKEDFIMDSKNPIDWHEVKARPMGGWGRIQKRDTFIAWLKEGKGL